jgi:hemerythrin-like domain-containing protein
MKPECFTKSISTDKLVFYINLIQKHLDKSNSTATANADAIYKISRIGLYSD